MQPQNNPETQWDKETFLSISPNMLVIIEVRRAPAPFANELLNACYPGERRQKDRRLTLNASQGMRGTDRKSSFMFRYSFG